MPPPDAWQFEAIGTAWQIDTATPLTPEVRDAITARIESFDAAWSRFRDDSLVSRIARSAGTWELPGEAVQLLGFYDELYELTGGAVNPLIGRTLADLGYDADYSLTQSAQVADVPDWLLVKREGSVVTTTEPLVIDVGAAGKGLLVDHVSSIVSQHTNQFTVDASGDMYHGGTTPIRVALEHPADPSRAIGVVELEPEGALCGSATNRRAWGDGLHHVLDGRTGTPTSDVVATWVVTTGSCMWADGIATALFLAEPDQLMPRFTYEYVRMHADGRVEWSPEFPGEVFA
jgi:thiamine biosynthesis lipoprotein